MSINFFLKSALTITCGLFVGYTGIQYFQQTNFSENSRNLASSPILKLGADHLSRDYYDIKITNELIAESKSTPAIINVQVTAKKDLPEGLQYKWALGEDVQSGDALEGSVFPLKAGESTEYKLQVTGFSKEVQAYVSFIISGKINGHNLRREALLSSRPEDSYEYVVQQNHLKEKSKVLNKLGLKKSKKFDPEKIVR